MTDKKPERSWKFPDGPYEVPAYGHDCYFTWLLDYIVGRVTQCESTQDDLKQEITLHLLKNVKHYREHAAMKPHSFIALQVRQAIDRFKKDPKFMGCDHKSLGDLGAYLTKATQTHNWRE